MQRLPSSIRFGFFLRGSGNIRLPLAALASIAVLAIAGWAQSVAVPAAPASKAVQASVPASAPDQSQQLLALANQLKSRMDHTTKDMLSVAVVRKADEIEKLAHQMRSK